MTLLFYFCNGNGNNNKKHGLLFLCACFEQFRACSQTRIKKKKIINFYNLIKKPPSNTALLSRGLVEHEKKTFNTTRYTRETSTRTHRSAPLFFRKERRTSLYACNLEMFYLIFVIQMKGKGFFFFWLFWCRFGLQSSPWCFVQRITVVKSYCKH